MSGRGRFITFEGGDGAGKSSQLVLLGDALTEAGIPWHKTREPGGTDLGVEIRQLLLHRDGHVDPRAEALLFAADRAHHIATVVRPALEAGVTVLQDRYFDSSVAYQGAGRSLEAAEVRALSMWATGSLLPDLTVLLDIDPEWAAARVGARAAADRIEGEADSFRRRLRDGFLAIAAAEPDRVFVTDAARSRYAIAADVWAEVRRRFSIC